MFKNLNSQRFQPVLSVLVFFFIAWVSSSCFCIGQQKKDPTAQTKVIQETLAKIRDVEKLDTYIEANKELKKQNALLQKSLRDLTGKVNKLTVQLRQQQESLRKQLLQMPKFQVQSKILGKVVSMAILESNSRTILIRSNTTMSVPVNNVWVLMEVRKITKDMIELYFPELKRSVFLND